MAVYNVCMLNVTRQINYFNRDVTYMTMTMTGRVRIYFVKQEVK